jgi:uncharacterized membrane protein
MNVKSLIEKQRFWEIDTLRGIAIIMMISYHILFDAVFLDIIQINLFSLPFRIFLYPIGTTFLFLAGVCLSLSYQQSKFYLSKTQLFTKFLRRGLGIFSVGLLITAVTYIFIGHGFIVFGVLHCIGVSIIVAYPFLTKKYISLITGFSSILAGIILRLFIWDFSYLVWLGFIPQGFYSLDYFPLLPWFGVILIGIGFSNIFYKNNKRQFSIADYSDVAVIQILGFIGKHSLHIYVIHQPIIIGVLVLFFK